MNLALEVRGRDPGLVAVDGAEVDRGGLPVDEHRGDRRRVAREADREADEHHREHGDRRQAPSERERHGRYSAGAGAAPILGGSCTAARSRAAARA